jgi:cytochrome b
MANQDHPPAGAGVQAPRTIRVWDPVVRLFHWSVVLFCFLDLAVFTDGKAVHRWIGYGVALALAIRVVWGFVGTKHARFADFAPSPRAVAAYLKAVMAGAEPRFIGHNPAGALMMLALMGLLAAVAATGWMLRLDAFFGNEELEEMHEALAYAIVPLVALHVAGALFESRRHGENLVWAMVTGKKRA